MNPDHSHRLALGIGEMRLVTLLLVCFSTLLQFTQAQQFSSLRSEKVLVLRKNNCGIIGELQGMRMDTLDVLVNGERVSTAKNDLIQVEIIHRSDILGEGVRWALLGAYFYTMASSTEPFSGDMYLPEYTLREKSFGSGILIATGVGALFGSLLGLLEGDEIIGFDFGSESQDGDQWNRLWMFSNVGRESRRHHFSMEGGYVGVRTLPSELRFQPGIVRGSGETRSNLLRSLRFTVSAKSDIRYGVGIIWFGEPFLSWYKHDEQNSYIEHSITQLFDAVGFFAIAEYQPLRNTLPYNVEWSIGGALGLSKVEYRLIRSTTKQDDWRKPPLVLSKAEENTVGSFLTGMLHTQANLFITNGLSVGVMADYVLVPGRTMPAIPELGIKSRVLGNYMLGFSLGHHF